MKKQILILFMAVFVLGANQAFGQDGPYLPPIQLDPDCIDLDNPLRPVPGRAYTYTVDVPEPDGTKTYHWYVTQDWNFITTTEADGTVLNDDTAEPADGNSPILASGSTWYDSESSEDNITLTWQSYSMNTYQHVFVVIYVTNDDGENCTTDNLKVYRIEPLHAFTLTVANIDADDLIDNTTTEVCVDDVRSAVFDPDYDGGNGGVVYDYGQNEFYFAVAAANFSGNFQLSAAIDGLMEATDFGNTGQSAEVFWNTSLADLKNAESGDGLTIDDGGVIVGEISPDAGVSFGEGQLEEDDDAAFVFYIKVIIEHNQFEAANDVGYNYTLSLDAILPNDDGSYGEHIADNSLGDVDQLATGDDCLQRNPFGPHNQAMQTLLPRPTVESDPAGLLLPNAP